MLGDQLPVMIVILERSVDIVPRLIEFASGFIVEDAPRKELVVAHVLHIVVVSVVLGHVIGGVERFGRRIFIGGRRLGLLRIWRQELGQLQHAGFEGFVPGAFRVAQYRADRDAARTAVFAVSNDDAEHLVAIGADARVSLEIESSHARRQWSLRSRRKADRTRNRPRRSCAPSGLASEIRAASAHSSVTTERSGIAAAIPLRGLVPRPEPPLLPLPAALGSSAPSALTGVAAARRARTQPCRKPTVGVMPDDDRLALSRRIYGRSKQIKLRCRGRGRRRVPATSARGSASRASKPASSRVE